MSENYLQDIEAILINKSVTENLTSKALKAIEEMKKEVEILREKNKDLENKVKDDKEQRSELISVNRELEIELRELRNKEEGLLKKEGELLTRELECLKKEAKLSGERWWLNQRSEDMERVLNTVFKNTEFRETYNRHIVTENGIHNPSNGCYEGGSYANPVTDERSVTKE